MHRPHEAGIAWSHEGAYSIVVSGTGSYSHDHDQGNILYVPLYDSSFEARLLTWHTLRTGHILELEASNAKVSYVVLILALRLIVYSTPFAETSVATVFRSQNERLASSKILARALTSSNTHVDTDLTNYGKASSRCAKLQS